MHYIFDIGGVLIRYNQDQFIESLSKKYSRPVSEVKKIFTRERLYMVETGRISGKDYFDNIISKILDNTYDDWIASIMDAYTLNPEGMQLLQILKERENNIYILSNQAEYNYIAIQKKFPGFFDMCKHNFLSYKMKLFKPEIEFYMQACKRIGTVPSQCVFFDDMEENVKGAIKAGMKGIHFLNHNIHMIRMMVEELK